MKAKRVLALFMTAVLEISSLGTAYMPVHAEGEAPEVSVGAVYEDEAQTPEETVSEEAAEEEEAAETGKTDETVSEDAAQTPEETEETEAADASDEVPAEETDQAAGVDISSYLTINDKGEITKYDYSGTDITDIIIPSVVNGVTVKAIGNSVFKNHVEIISVQLPSTLKTIGDSAFENSNLGSNKRDGKLVIPASVEYIGISAFSKCNALATVTFEAGEGTINFAESWGNGHTFAKCEYLTTINLSNRISSLTPHFASGCKALTKVVWSETLKTINDCAFEDDVLLDSTDLSSTSVEYIGAYAFSGCGGFGLVKFPQTLKTIGDYAFQKTLMGKRSTPGTLVIPASVEKIGLFAFTECEYLETLTFDAYKDEAFSTPIAFSENWGNGGTFKACKNLKTINFSNKISELNPHFAESCKSLTTINWGPSIKIIGDYAFSDDLKLESTDFSATALEVIGEGAFLKCSSFGAPKFPESLRSIGVSAFQNTPMGKEGSLGKLVIPSAIEYIGHLAFKECPYLGEVEFKYYNGQIALDPVKLNENWGVGETFANCGALKKITLSDRVSELPAGFARNCTALTTVKWSPTVTVIGDSAFYGDNLLNSPDFSATSLKTIGTEAFAECSSFGLAKFPKSLKNINNAAFKKTAMGNKNSGGVLFISEEVSYIGAYAFNECAYLSGVVIEDYTGDGSLPILSVGDNWGNGYNFAGCPMLEEIVVSDRITKLPYFFAGNCPALCRITIPDGVETIEQGAFYVETKNGDKVKTDVTGESDVVKNYDWDKDNRVIAKVTKIPVESVTLDKTSVEVSVGKYATLKATVNPSDATNKSVYWGSSNSEVATVENGRVKGVGVGEAVITVTTVDGEKKASATVKVTEGSGNGEEEEEGDEQEVSLPGKKNTTVTALLKFVTNGADEGQEFYSYAKSGKKISLNNKFLKKGYTFKGWYCTYIDKKGKEKTKKVKSLTAATLEKYAVEGVVTLNAHFAVNSYSIKFNKSAKFEGKKVKVSGKVHSQKLLYSSDGENINSVTMDGNEIICKNPEIELKGWTTVKKGTEVMFEVGEVVSLEDLVPAKGKTIKLYAVYGRK